MKTFQGRTAVITGAGSGFGLEVARLSASRGMRLVLVDVQADALERAADEMRGLGAEVLAARVDVSKADDMEALGAQVRARFGAPHVVFNNAGIGAGGLIWENTLKDWEWVIGVWGGLLMTLGAALSIGGNVGNTMLVGSRYLYALASSGFGPPILARVHPRFQTPAWAIVTQAVLTAALALSGSFVQLALLSVVARTATYIGTAAAVPVLRRKFPAKDRTIVLPGGATIPALALLVCVAFLASSTATNLAAGLIALVLGAAVYAFRRQARNGGVES
jgi:amino acid transporter